MGLSACEHKHTHWQPFALLHRSSPCSLLCDSCQYLSFIFICIHLVVLNRCSLPLAHSLHKLTAIAVPLAFYLSQCQCNAKPCAIWNRPLEFLPFVGEIRDKQVDRENSRGKWSSTTKSSNDQLKNRRSKNSIRPNQPKFPCERHNREC